MEKTGPNPVVFRFWDAPPTPELVLKSLEVLFEHDGDGSILPVLDFGPAFPWSTEPRLCRGPRYPETFFGELAGGVFKHTQVEWYLPLQPGVWTGDLPCYDALDSGETGAGCASRFLIEQISDLEAIGFGGIRIALDPGPYRGTPAAKEFMRGARTRGIPVSVLPSRVQVASVFARICPAEAEVLRRRSYEAGRAAAQGVGVLDALGELFQGSVRGYRDRRSYLEAYDRFRSAAAEVESGLKAWILDTDPRLLAGAAVQIAESRLYAVRAVSELIAARSAEYERFRMVYPESPFE